MSPQFVDFDHDGHIDIVTATYDGSPHIARGSADGFLKPEHILDQNGRRITLTRWYDHENRTYANATDQGEGRLTSAVAIDWDGNGVYDLLLGDKEEGYLYLRVNHGTKEEARFDTDDVPVLADGKPLIVPGGITSPRLVDFDGDGNVDLLIGSYGASFGGGTGGAVYWYRNLAAEGEPRYAAPITLIEPSPKGHSEPVRPDAGLYVDAHDYDNDGRLDLIVGAYSMWTPPQRPLDEAEQAELAKLKAARAAVGAELNSVGNTRSEERQEILQRRAALLRQIHELVPPPQRKPFVWVYRQSGADGE